MIENFKLYDNPEKVHDQLIKTLSNNEKGYVFAVNTNILVYCHKDKNYRKIIENSILNVCDGINVSRINNISNKPKVNVLTGPDLFEFLIQKDYKQFFLGGEKKVIEGLKKNKHVAKLHNNDNMFYSPPYLDVEDFNYKEIGNLINSTFADIIWVGLGAPKQEIFTHRLLPHLNKGVVIAVGAAFNFFSGIDEYKRAPIIMRKYHLEWLFRSFQEPRKIIKRQLKCLIYLPIIIFQEIINK